MNKHEKTSFLGEHTESVWCVSYSPDGSHIVSADRGKKGNNIKIWDINNGKCVLTLSAHALPVPGDGLHTATRKRGSRHLPRRWRHPTGASLRRAGHALAHGRAASSRTVGSRRRRTRPTASYSAKIFGPLAPNLLKRTRAPTARRSWRRRTAYWR